MMIDQPDRQLLMRGGIRWLDSECRKRFGQPFVKMHRGPADRDLRRARVPGQGQAGALARRPLLQRRPRPHRHRLLHEQDRHRRPRLQGQHVRAPSGPARRRRRSTISASATSRSPSGTRSRCSRLTGVNGQVHHLVYAVGPVRQARPSFLTAPSDRRTTSDRLHAAVVIYPACCSAFPLPLSAWARLPPARCCWPRRPRRPRRTSPRSGPTSAPAAMAPPCRARRRRACSTTPGSRATATMPSLAATIKNGRVRHGHARVRHAC